ncbi:MAG: imidazoleglycerol-phosphate dehydratase HisB [Vallitaleaceae bacterium]|nr:imidazoleglycerol-phosphate dehydratase HisB [Vallitaleaceae bacterium]
MSELRKASLHRESKETSIQITANLDGVGRSEINTGIGFFDHMLNHLAKYSFIDLSIEAKGDLHIDSHHTIEDIGIVLGDCLTEAFGDKSGIKRYGFSGIPMDEVLVLCSIDLSGRPYLSFQAPFTCDRLGTMDTEMVEEFFRALAVRLKMNCHIEVLHGKNNHHIAEGIFKAFGKALDEAKTVDPRIIGAHSTKGMFD